MSKSKYITKQEIAPMALSSTEAAILIGVSQHKLELSRITGELCGAPPPKFFRIGRKLIRYKRADLEQWVNERPCYDTLAEEYVTEEKAAD